jgi:cell division GTPase FtsZ
MRFDGNWREDKMSEAEYMKAYAAADEAYARAIQALIEELKKGS